MAEDHSDVTLDHDYDGIQEYDNRLPNWWLFILYGSIVFSVGYWLFYETFLVGSSQSEVYEHEVEVAAQAQLEREMGKEVTAESLLLMTKVSAQVAAGSKIFMKNCSRCHGVKGEGGIGPNLTDEHWLHGPWPLQIYNTVMNGVLDKGMQAWKGQLGPSRVRQVVSYVLTIKGRKETGKAPQGKPLAEWPEPKPPEEKKAGDKQAGDKQAEGVEKTAGGQPGGG